MVNAYGRLQLQQQQYIPIRISIIFLISIAVVVRRSRNEVEELLEEMADEEGELVEVMITPETDVGIRRLCFFNGLSKQPPALISHTCFCWGVKFSTPQLLLGG